MSIDVVEAIAVDDPVGHDFFPSDEQLPQAVRYHPILPVATEITPLPQHPFDLACEEFLLYFKNRLGFYGSQFIDASNLITVLMLIEEGNSFLIDPRVRRKAKIAHHLLVQMLRYEGMNDPSQFLVDLALFIHEDRSEQGFSVPPFTLFVHKTKGFSRFSKVLEKVAQAVMDESMVANPNFSTLMKKSLSSIDVSIGVTHNNITSQQENIIKESSEVLKKIASIDASCRENMDAAASSPLDREKVNQIKEQSFKEISGLNRGLAAFVGSVKQKINQLKKDLGLMTGMRGVFSTFMEYLDRKNSESISPTPSV